MQTKPPVFQYTHLFYYGIHNDFEKNCLNKRCGASIVKDHNLLLSNDLVAEVAPIHKDYKGLSSRWINGDHFAQSFMLQKEMINHLVDTLSKQMSKEEAFFK